MGGKLPPFAVSESDGNPTVYQPWNIIFPNGSVTDVGNGTVFVNPGSAASATYTAATPILVRGTVFSLNTDGNTGNFLNGAGVFTTPSGGSSIAYAPSGATYIVQTNDSVLANEQVLAALSTGLLKNTAVTGVLTNASGGIDFENVLSVSSPIVKNFSTISISQASTGASGFLHVNDFKTFLAKASTDITITVLSPLSGGGSLASNRTIALTTNGNTSTFLNGLGNFTTPSGGGPVVYAPTGATYIIQTNDAIFPNAQVLASLSTGMLKNTAVTGILTNASGGIDFENILVACSPLLKSFSTLSINTNGNSGQFLNGIGTFTTPSGGSGIVYATTNATYILQTADATLTSSQVLASLPTGIMKSTTTTGVISIASGGIDFENVLTFSSPLVKTFSTISINTASAASPGFLRTADFNLFNAKASTATTITCSAPMSGGGTIAANRTIWMLSSTAASDGYLKGADFKSFTNKASTATTITVLGPLSGGGSLAANRTIALTTNGNTATFLNGLGSFTTPSGGSAIAYAPSGATYIVQTNDAILSNEQVLAALSTGLLKNTAVTGVLTVASGGIDFENILVAASPLLKTFSTLSLITDGTTTNYLRGDGTYAIPSSDSGVKIAVFTVYSSASWTADSVPIFQAPYNTPITLKQINVTSSGSSPLPGFNIETRPWGRLANTGSNVLSAMQSAPSTGIEITSAISTTVISAKAHLVLATSAMIQGLMDYITGVIYYSRNSN